MFLPAVALASIGWALPLASGKIFFAMTAEPTPIAGEKRDLRRGALQILGGTGVRIIARVLLITFVARMYGIDDFGRLGETVAVIELLSTFATFGLSKTLLGRLSEGQDDSAVGAQIIKAAIFAGILSFSMAALLWLAWPFLASPDLHQAKFVLLGIPLIALAEIATTATRHFRTAFWDTFVKAFVKPWSFLLLSLAAFYGFVSENAPFEHALSSEQALLVAYVGALLLTACAAGVALAKSFGPGFFGQPIGSVRAGLADLGKSSWPIALNETGLYAFRRIDVILLAMVSGPKETAIYYLARQIGTVVEKIRYLYEPILSPIIAQSKSLDTIGAHLKRLGFLIFSAQLGAICVFAIFGIPILAWFGGGFATGLMVLLVILAGELFDGSFGLCELPMVYRHPAWPPRLVLGTLALEIVLVWFLAQEFGALGAAIGFAISMVVLAGLRVAMVRRLYGFKVLDFRQPIMIAAAIGVIFWAGVF